jgi:hypothetical protein
MGNRVKSFVSNLFTNPARPRTKDVSAVIRSLSDFIRVQMLSRCFPVQSCLYFLFAIVHNAIPCAYKKG